MTFASLLAVTALVAAAGCGKSGDDEPGLIKEGSLRIALEPATGGAPTEFHQELIEDLALRLGLDVAFAADSSGNPAGQLTAHRADAAAPVPIRPLTAGRLSYTAPYWQDPETGTLYGMAILAGPDPDEEPALLEDLDEALSELKDDGTLQKLYDKWFPGKEVSDPVLNDVTQ